MIYGQDCVSEIGTWVLTLGCIAGCCVGLRCLMQLDVGIKQEKKICWVSPVWVSIFCMISSNCVCWILELENATCQNYVGWEDMVMCRKVFSLISLSIVAACLMAATIMDIETHAVYNYLWWIMGVVGIFRVIILNGGERISILMPLLLFILLQELFFCNMYGRADCHGFAACALVGASFGMGLKQFLLHMLIAFGLLGIVQLTKRNVGRNGNLKKPVPFLPYLTLAFWVNLGAYLCV